MKAGVRADWRAAILICRKCEKQLGGGFGADGDRRLSKLLRQRHGGKGRKAGIGVIAIECLDICPRRGVVVIDGARPRDWLIVAAGTPIDQVEARLGLEKDDLGVTRSSRAKSRDASQCFSTTLDTNREGGGPG